LCVPKISRNKKNRVINKATFNQKAPSTTLQGCGALVSFIDPSFKSFSQDRAYSNLYRN